MYQADNPVTVLACKVQKKVCFPSASDPKNCSPWATSLDIVATNVTDAVESNIRNVKLVEWYNIAVTARDVGMAAVADNKGAIGLLAREYFGYGVSAGLPKNQWQTDVEFWHAVSLSSLQGGPVQIAAGMSNTPLSDVTRPPSPEAWNMCRSQVRRAHG